MAKIFVVGSGSWGTAIANVLAEKKGIKDIPRDEILVNVVGVNHFTWLKEARYRNIDIYPIYKESVEEIKRRLANGEKIKLKIPSRDTERVRSKND